MLDSSRRAPHSTESKEEFRLVDSNNGSSTRTNFTRSSFRINDENLNKMDFDDEEETVVDDVDDEDDLS